MVSSGLLRRVAHVRTDISEEPGASFIRVTEISALGTTQAATSNRRTLRRNATRRNNPEDTILHSHRRENLKSYISISHLHNFQIRHQINESNNEFVMFLIITLEAAILL
jgi:hypothetical protein